MFRLKYRLGLVVSAVLLSVGGCMTSSFALNVSEDTGRFAINDTRLGQKITQVLSVAERHFGQKPVCENKKTGNRNNKKAHLLQVCRFESPVEVYLARQKVVAAEYHFLDGELQQIDLEIEAVNTDGNAREEIESAISQSLGKDLERQGPVNSWIGEFDAVMLARQGNFQLRVLNRLLLPESPDYTKITPRQH